MQFIKIDRIIILSIVYGILFWVIDALISYLSISQESFWRLLIFDLSIQRLYPRLVVLGGFIIFGILISRSLVQRRKREEELAYIATHDILTGLANRALFNDRLNIELARVQRTRKKLALILLDLDFFKNVNDMFGHKIGDKLLRSVGERLVNILRRDDTVARIGGDEFILILPGISLVEDVFVVSGRIIKAFQEPFFIEDKKIHITASAGIAIYPYDGKNAEILIKNADIAMYWVKRKGKNNYQRYAPYMSGKSLKSPSTGVIKGNSDQEREIKRDLRMLKGSIEDIIYTMARIVKAKDSYTFIHQQKVAQLICAIAEELGLEEEKVDNLCFAAKIHDIGKIHIPTDILNKPGKLEEKELEIVKTHPQVGCEILREVHFPWPVAEIILQHHERLDGSGYPRGLSDDDIILEARILAVADVVEAMSSDRPYRPALGVDKALEEILKNKGVLYDPEIVDICVRLFVEKNFNFDRYKKIY
ncbi:diguanylate cyclase [Candidatus Aerophobetes bacterium]|nr:diguanylate cyclase [Candidatus Aerophobetes bacterium]